MRESQSGEVPPAEVASGWVLVASKVCQTDDGRPMIHNVYMRGGRTLSLHFLPPEGSGDRESTSPREIAGDDFPVMAWEESGWTVTACSTDLDAAGLASTVSAN
jgi:hypothetical protein